MLDLPDQPILDKRMLIGGCLRLPLRIDASRLWQEVAGLPVGWWGSAGGRVGVHQVAQAVFLRGRAPAEGDHPIQDRSALAELPYVREIISELIPARALRCLLARLPAGAVVAPHIDRPPYFAKSLRIHVPVQTNDSVHMLASGLCYTMLAGEVWALNNSATHAVWNAHATESRTHLICDFLADPALLQLLARGDRNLGAPRPEVETHVRDARPHQSMGQG